MEKHFIIGDFRVAFRLCYNNEKCQRRRCLQNGPIVASCFQAKCRSEILSRPCFPSAEKIPVQLCPTALTVLDPVNMPAESFIFHSEDEIEFLATIN